MAAGFSGHGDRLEMQNQLRLLANGGRIATLVAAVAELGIADALADGPLRCDELAERTATHASSVYRVLRALAMYHVFEELADGRFALTPMADLLRSDVAGSLRDSVRHAHADYMVRPWAEVTHTLKTGETAFNYVHGVGLFDYLANHPEASDLFNRAMAGRAGAEHTPTSEIYDFSASSTVVDVGGGHGGILTAILQHFPHLRGILFDRPGVVESARSRLIAAGVAERCTFEGGDFFDRVPSGGDTYLLSRVIHDWDDDLASKILRNCREAIRENGKLLLLEEIIPAGNDFHPGKLMDMSMLVLVGGRERTEAEFRTLFRSSGFLLTRVYPTQSSVSVLEAAPA